MNVIEVEQLTKYYGKFLAVDHLNFSVEKGEIFAIIGPNGAGKSSTIRMMLDILKPDSGRIAILGGPLTEATKNKIGYLPEERGLYKNVPILQLLIYLGQLKGMSKADAQQRGITLLEQLELGAYRKSKLTALSKGMAQKVQFIATILHRPELIIIDEPFSGLDPVNVQLLKDVLYTSAHQDGVAIVMSTHQMHQLQEMADRMLMIAKGQRVLYGAVDDVRRQYAQNRVVVAGEGDWASLPGVMRVENHSHKTSDKILYLNDQTTPEQIMQAMVAGNYHIRHFEIEIPDLEEVFIRVVGGEVKA